MHDNHDLGKRITPELSSVMHAAGGKISRFTSAAFTKMDEMIGVDGSETRAHIALFTTTLAQNVARYAVYEGFKLIPGEMGYWNMIGDGGKRITPELSSVMHATGGEIYRFISAAFTKMDEMIGVDGSETRAHIGLFTTTFNAARYAVYQGFKLSSGVNVVTELVSNTMNDMRDKNSNHPASETKQEEVDTSDEETEHEEVDPSKE